MYFGYGSLLRGRLPKGPPWDPWQIWLMVGAFLVATGLLNWYVHTWMSMPIHTVAVEIACEPGCKVRGVEQDGVAIQPEKDGRYVLEWGASKVAVRTSRGEVEGRVSPQSGWKAVVALPEEGRLEVEGNHQEGQGRR